MGETGVFCGGTFLSGERKVPPRPLQRKPLYAVHPSKGGAGDAGVRGYGERELPFLL